MIRLLVFALAGLLAVLSLFIAYYGATAMYTSEGVSAPNVIVWLGLTGFALVVVAVARMSRRSG